MKTILILLSLITVGQGCRDIPNCQEPISIAYTAHSRGLYNYITIDKNMIAVIRKRGTKPVSRPNTEREWETLLDHLKNIDLKNLPKLKAPSEARSYDGAAIANLKITCHGDTYQTPSFDHGHPPKEIEALVKEILSIAETID